MNAQPPIKIQEVYSRPLENEEDFWMIYDLLVETYPITPLFFNWDVRRWEGKRFYEEKLDAGKWVEEWSARARLWLTTDEERVVAVAHDEGPGWVYLQLHPDYRLLEGDMLVWAEEHMAQVVSDGEERQLHIYVPDYDKERQALLVRRGYEKLPSSGVMRRMPLAQVAEIEPPPLAEGYVLRATDPENMVDCQEIAAILNAAFERDFHNAAEYRNFTQQAPSFRQDLDLVAVAPDGTFAAYVGVLYDEANKRGIFEPVCTHPNHQRKGLAKAVMIEGLRRLQKIGATSVTVETGDKVPANRLYDSLGFSERETGAVWRKRWPVERGLPVQK